MIVIAVLEKLKTPTDETATGAYGREGEQAQTTIEQGERELLAKLQESLRLVELAKLHLAVRSHRRQSKEQRPELN